MQNPDYILAWAVGALTCGSILMWWFNTNLPRHIMEVLRFLRFKRRSDFWTLNTPVGGLPRVADIKDFSDQDFKEWLYLKFPSWLGELMNCPGCFSFHVSFWVALTVQCLTGFDLLFFTSCVATWPIVGNMLLKTTRG